MGDLPSALSCAALFPDVTDEERFMMDSMITTGIVAFVFGGAVTYLVLKMTDKLK